jgi:hypothetical protein
MGLSPSWETASCTAAQEFPNILWKSKVNCHVHKIPPLFTIQGQINPVHTILFFQGPFQYYPRTYFQVFLVVSFLLDFAPIPIRIPFDPMRSTFPAHLIILDLIILIVFREEHKL